MEKIEFKDYPSVETPINSNNLNKLQANVESAIDSANTNITNAQNNIDDITTNIDEIETDIANIKTNASNLTSRVSKIENYKGIAAYGDGFVDATTTTEHLLLTQIGTPNQSLYFVITLFFSVRTATANRTQVAIPYNFDTVSLKNTVYIRYYFNGAWTTWRLVNS